MRRPTDPLTGFRFVLELGFLEVGAFSECTGLAVDTKTFEYREGGRNSSVLKFPGGRQDFEGKGAEGRGHRQATAPRVHDARGGRRWRDLELRLHG